MTRRAALFTAGVAGFLGIALGAFGAHSLKGVLEANQSRDLWNTAVLYLLALTKIAWLGIITPLGGLLLIAGWAVVGIKAIRL